MSSTSDLDSFAARLRGFIRAAECGVRPSSVAALRKVESMECGIKLEPPHVGCYEDGFDSLALELFALQFKHNAPYRRFCESRGALPGAVEHWYRIPTIPTSSFKGLELSSLPAGQRTAVFHSSTTTGKGASRHFHNADSLAVYEASLLAWFKASFQRQFPLTPALSPSEGERENRGQALCEGTFVGGGEGSLDASAKGERLVILTPPPNESPHSSLVHMFDTLRREFGSADSVYLGHSSADGSWMIEADAALEVLSKFSAANPPVLMLGTAFSFVHLLDDLARRGRRFDMPPGSRAMETGGYKGRSRSLPKAELHAFITDHLGIPATNIICEYGMSELSSQAYDRATSDEWRVTNGRKESGRPLFVTRHFHFPPWSRVQIISPETGREVAEGETGLIRVFDLANVYSVMAIQTEDLGIRRGDGFELVGRATLAEARGCSLMAV